MLIKYNAPPTVSRFMESASFGRLIAGPIGSGKTTGCIFEILRRGVQQIKGPDGFRRTRWAIVRQTLAQLKMTVLIDILNWFRPIAQYKVSESLVVISFNDVVIELYFIPLEDEKDQKRLLSMQLTGAWLSEAIEIQLGLVDAIAGRCGRYPSAADGGATWSGVIADTNFPVEGSDWQKFMEEEKPIDWQIFKQPGGMTPAAENLAWLVQTPETLQLDENDPIRIAQGRVYYERASRNGNKNWVDRYVNAIYGEDPSGTAVFRESYKRTFHITGPKELGHSVEEIEPVHGFPLLVGQDFGRNPCSLICQPDHKGRLLVLEEIIAEDIGLENHVSRYLKPRLFQDRYLGKQMALVGDPSGRAKGNFLEEDSFDVLHRLGLPAFPSTTNDIDPRIRAVEALLLQQRDGGPAIIVDATRCPQTARALGGSYMYGKTRLGQTKPVPEKKHPASDIMDCLQYVCLVYNSGMVNFITRKLVRKQAPQNRGQPAISSAGWT
jgi:hypothetical protein